MIVGADVDAAALARVLAARWITYAVRLNILGAALGCFRRRSCASFRMSFN